jgi:hypothetical protein
MRRARNRGLKFVAMLLLVFAAVGAPASRGQRAEKCNESIVKKKSVVPVTESAAEDIYANTTNSKGPVKGKREVEALRAATLAERKNSKPAIFWPDKIVASKVGDMAYTGKRTWSTPWRVPGSISPTMWSICGCGR